MDTQIVYIIALVAGSAALILLGTRMPAPLRTLLYNILATLATKIIKGITAPAKATKVVVPVLEPPRYEGLMTGAQIRKLLKPLGIEMYATVDKVYHLAGLDEIERFLKHYHSALPYTTDDFDCDDHAWLMRAEALRWSKGKLAWGYVEGKSIMGASLHRFGNHAFCVVVVTGGNAYYVDELGVAAGKDKPVKAYSITCYTARI